MKGNKQMKNMTKIDKQVEILDKITNKAIKKVELEPKNKSRNYIVEWFRYVELVGKDLNKYEVRFNENFYIINSNKFALTCKTTKIGGFVRFAGH